MNIIFAHDEKLQKNGDKYYSTGSLGSSIYSRYLKYYDNVTLLLRSENIIDNKKNLTLIDSNHVNIVEIDDFKKISIKNRLKINRIIQEEIKESDKVIARLPSIIGGIAIKYAKKHNKPYAIELVGCPFDALWNHGSILAKFLAPVMYLNTKRMVKNAKNVLYVTEHFLQNRYPNAKNTLACSDVEIERIDLEKLENKLKNYNPNKKVKIGIIGTLTTKYKGHADLFRAIAILKKKYNIKLHMLGYGELSNWINLINELGIHDNLIFDGTRESGQQVREWLDDIDIYVQPSLTEGMPRSTIEAMSRGCVVISTNVGGFPEIIKNDFMVNKGDYKEIANKIDKLSKNINFYKNEAIKNYEFSKKFSKEMLEKKRDKFYESI